MYVGTRPRTADAAVDAIRDELGRLARDGLEPDELEQTKRQVKGQIMLSLESTSARLYRLAGFALYEEPRVDLDELLARLDAVDAEAVAEAAATFYDPARQYVLRLGPEGGVGDGVETSDTEAGEAARDGVGGGRRRRDGDPGEAAGADR